MHNCCRYSTARSCLHIKYTATEALCGHFHELGRRKERRKLEASNQLRAELSAQGYSINSKVQRLIQPKIDTSPALRKIKCSDCLVKLDSMMETMEKRVVSVDDKGMIRLKTPPDEPEYRSIDDFCNFLKDDERTTFTAEDLTALRSYLEVSASDLRFTLKARGFTLFAREVPKKVRGFSTSSNDRWFGPGSERTHGGGGQF